MGNKPQSVPPGMERPAGGPTSPPSPRVQRHDIVLLIYRESLPPVRMSGFANVDVAIAHAKEWHTRAWYAVEVNGERVVEESRRRK